MMGHSDGRRFTRRRRGQRLLTPHNTQVVERHGRKGIKINVWGAIHSKGVGKLIRVEGNLTAVQYVDILENALVPLYDELEAENPEFLYFQQDNDPKHTSKLAKAFLRDTDIKNLKWPPKSPDVSPIENGWAELKRRMRLDPRYPKIQTADQLFELAKEIWETESFREYVIKLYKSFPTRLGLLKENNFLWIDY